MATCSSDHTIKVWNKNEEGKWVISSSWRAHSGNVFKLCWAHPEFGTVIASCSFDKTAAIWEESIERNLNAPPKFVWIRRAVLADSRASVTDIKFSPKTLGLIIATCSSDGILRIYEAIDAMNLTQWTLQHEISCKMPLSCIGWNPSLFKQHPPMLAVGSDLSHSNEPKVYIFEYSESNRRWSKTCTINVFDPVHDLEFSPNTGRTYHVLAVASKDVKVFDIKPIIEQSGNRFEIVQSAQFNESAQQTWTVMWNATGNALTTSSGEGIVNIWNMNYLKSFKCTATYTPKKLQHRQP